MTRRRCFIAAGLLCLVAFWWVDYGNQTDDWFQADERLRLGLPFSPWFDYWWWSNPIEGGGRTKIHPLSLSSAALVAGFWLLGTAWASTKRTPTTEEAPDG